jgi:hypothetical protein
VSQSLSSGGHGEDGNVLTVRCAQWQLRAPESVNLRPASGMKVQW